MTRLNKAAADVITRLTDAAPAASTGQAAASGSSKPRFEVHAATDVTGFGLLGHAREVALASHVTLRIRAAHVALLPGALECVRAGFIPGGLKANREFVESCVGFAASVPQELRTMFYDPQTAGGLLLSVAAPSADSLLAALRAAGAEAVEIGDVAAKAQPLMSVA